MDPTCSTAVWECQSWEKHTIIKRIADYVLVKHLSLQKDDLIHVVDQLDFSLLVDGQGKFQIFLCVAFQFTYPWFKLIPNYADPVSSSGALLEAFDTMAKQLRLLDDIPLKISTVQPLDSGLTQYLFVLFMHDLVFTISLIVCDISFVFPFLTLAFRHTSVFPPEPHPLAYGRNSQRLPKFATTCIRSLEVMIQV